MKIVRFCAILSIIALFAGVTSCGEDDNSNISNKGGASTVTGTVAIADVKKAGSLSSLIPDNVKLSITNLTVTGDINGDDIILIREMAGVDINGDKTNGHLSILNLKGAKIVSGGNPYYIKSTKEVFHVKKDIIGSYLFSNCDYLTSVVFPSNAIEVGSYIFSNMESENTALTSVVLGNEIMTIEYAAFYSCKSLSSINLPDNIQAIKAHAFHGCKSLGSINLPNNLRILEYCAFAECTDLSSINFPNNIQTIEGSAFSGCTNLVRINIPASVIEIGDGAFG